MSHVLTVGGVDITDDVEFTKSNFVSLVNGTPGQCLITIRDPGRTFDFTPGARILLKINNLNVWAGYLLKVRRVYPFVAHSPSGIRLYELVGLDINLLFTKRFVYKQSDPTANKVTFAGGTLDTVALTSLFNSWIDLSGDDLDTSSLVTSVGPMTPSDQEASPIWPGQPWSVTMGLIGRMLSPVWYLNPDRKLVWGDVDVEDAPYTLTDNPSTDPLDLEIGYQGFSLFQDGTQLTNDVLFVGAGNGDSKIVYKRVTDYASVMRHGRWQEGGLIQGIWKQATIDETARSYVYGSPFSKRGRKDDKTVINCVVFTDGFRAGQKVRVINGPWGYDDIIPIRQMRITWPVPFKPKYDLMLSHELDSPYNLFDPFTYDAPGGDYPTPIPSTPEIPKPKPPDWKERLYFYVHSGQSCDPMEPNVDSNLLNSFEYIEFWVPDEDGTQYLFETFNRADAELSWGTSTDGHTWTKQSGYHGTLGRIDINSNRGDMTVFPPWRNIAYAYDVFTDPDGPWSNDKFYIHWKWKSYWQQEDPLGRSYWFELGIKDASDDVTIWSVRVSWDGMGDGSTCDNQGNCADVNVGPPGTDNEGEAWVEPQPDGDSDHKTCINTNTCIEGGDRREPDEDYEERVTDGCCGEEIIGPTAIDDFERTVSSGWGTATSGQDWKIFDGGAANMSGVYVDGSAGVLNYSTIGDDLAVSLPFTSAIEAVKIDFSMALGSNTDVYIGGWDPDDWGNDPFSVYQGYIELYCQASANPDYWEFYVWGDSTYYDAINTFALTAGATYSLYLARAGNALYAMVKSGETTVVQGSIVYTGSWTEVFALQYGSDTLKLHDISSAAVVSTSYPIDDFNRTLTGSWGGTSSEGDTWMTDGDFTLAVSGGIATATFSGNGSGVMSLNEDGSVVWPYYLSAGGFPDGLLDGLEAVVSIEFKASVWTSAVIDFALVESDTVGEFGISCSMSTSGNFSIDSYDALPSSTPFSFLADTWYTVKWGYTEGAAKAKIWNSNSAEPGWMVTCASRGLPATPGEIYILPDPDHATVFSFRNLDAAKSSFDFVATPGHDASGACFWIDTFDRTESNTWGAGSYLNSWSETVPANFSTGVASGAGYLTVGDASTYLDSAAQKLTGTGPWNDGPGFTWLGEFRVRDLGANAWPYVSVNFGVRQATSSPVFDRYTFTESVLWDYSTAPGTNVNFPLVEDQAYTFRWEYGWNGLTADYTGQTAPPGVNRMKVWKSEESEPSDWTIDIGDAWVWINPATYPFISVVSGGPNGGRGYTADVFWTSFSRCVAGASNSANNAYGWNCEDFVGGKTTYFLSNPYTLTTVRVLLNGTEQFDFTATGGTQVVLGFTTTTTDKIKICYLVAGTSGDGWSDGGPGGPYPV